MRKRQLIIIGFLVLLAASISFAAFGCNNSKPINTVRQYWKFCLEKKFDEANKLKSNSTSQSPMEKDADLSSKDSTVSVSVGGSFSNAAGNIEDCCYAQEIAESKLKVTKIVEEKVAGLNAKVVVETEDLNKRKKNYVNCLVNLDAGWIITKIHTADSEEEACFPSEKVK